MNRLDVKSSCIREWMLRAFAISLAVATIRPIVGVFLTLADSQI
jgi:hypothetical protein